MESSHCEDDDFRLIFGTTRIAYDADKEDCNRTNHKYSLASAVDFLEHCISLANARPYIFRDAATTSERRHEHMQLIVRVKLFSLSAQ